MTNKPKFMIVDGNSFMHRAYHGLPPMANKEGFPTHIINGVCNMVNSLVTKFKPEMVVIAFDHKGKNFRHDMYSDYKGNRNGLDDDFIVQIEPLKAILSSWGFPLMSVEGVEADDSMTALGKQAKEAGYSAVLVTSDKDMCQAIEEDIGLLDTKDAKNGDVIIYRDGVKEKLGVYPEQVIPFLALIGDKVDNISGVDGVGDITAAKWLEEYKTKDALIANVDNLKGKVALKFKEAIEDGSYDLAIRLVTIKTDIDFGKKPSEFIGKKDDQLLFELLSKFEMHKLKKTLKLVDKDAKTATQTIIEDPEQVRKYISTLFFKEQSFFMETEVIDGNTKLLVSTENTNDIFMIDIKTYKNELLKQFRLISKNHEARIISLNTKALLYVLYTELNDETLFKCRIDDVRVYDYVNGSGRSKFASFENLNNDYCQFSLSPLRGEFKIDSKKPKWNKMTKAEVLEVRSEDLNLAKAIINNKKSDYDLKSSVMDNQMIPVLAKMELNGVKIDPDKLSLLGNKLSLRIEDLETAIYAIAGETFNIASPKKVSDILFNKLEIPSKKKSTGEDVLLKIISDLDKNDKIDEETKNDFKIVLTSILKHRSLSKLKSTYISGLIDRMDKDNLLHTTYNLTTTATGRLSSEDPNLQAIPVKSSDGRKIREAFVADDGYLIFAVDYSQVELRILAHFANETNFINAFKNGEDIHKLTASKVFHITLDEVTDEQRRVGKATNFGLIYGMGDKRLAEELNITRKEAKLHLKNFFESYPQIKPYYELELENATKNLYVETLLGRRISARDIISSNSFIRSHGEKAAKNAKIQGTAAEIMKKAMIAVFDFMNENTFDASLIMQVHDELVFKVKEEDAESFVAEIKNIMENIVELKVPLIADCNTAKNWADAH